MMSQPVPYSAVVRYSYDGESESILLTVNASSTHEARQLARAEAEGILEEGLPFRITNVKPKNQQWARPWCVFKISEMAHLKPQLTEGQDPAADVAAINAYIAQHGRWDDLRALAVRPAVDPDSDLNIMVLWNERVMAIV